MNCVVPSTNIKVLGKAIQALSKVGDDLFMEAKTDQLSLITLNISKTVCAKYHFKYSFFSYYEVNEDELKNNNSDKISCKLHMKVLLPLFKGTSLEKKLDWIKVDYKNNNDLMEFKMKYKCDDILMIHKLRLMESETLTVKIDINSCINNLSATSSLFNQLLSMFSNSDDITFEISSNNVIARNYFVGAPHNAKCVRSQVHLNSSEFNVFKISVNTSINFSSKALRTAINFAESCNLNVNFKFEEGGKPLGIAMNHSTFEVEYIIATINPYSDTQLTSMTASSIPTKLSQPNTDRGNISVEDQQALDSENWDDFSMECDRTEKTKISNKKQTFKELLNKVEQTKTKSVENKTTKKIKDNLKALDEEKIAVIPPSPPESPIAKKAKVVFGRCMEETFSTGMLGDILVMNSDSE